MPRKSAMPDFDGMFADMMATCAPVLPKYDPAIHGLTTKDIAARRGCAMSTAKRIAEEQVHGGAWIATEVRDGRRNTTAYRAKGGAK